MTNGSWLRLAPSLLLVTIVSCDKPFAFSVVSATFRQWFHFCYLCDTLFCGLLAISIVLVPLPFSRNSRFQSYYQKLRGVKDWHGLFASLESILFEQTILSKIFSFRNLYYYTFFFRNLCYGYLLGSYYYNLYCPFAVSLTWLLYFTSSN